MRYKLFSVIKKYEKELEAVAKRQHCSKWWIYLDVVSCRLLYGMDANNYLSLGYHKMGHRERKTYLTRIKRDKLEKIMNTSEEWRRIIDDKAAFNGAMSDFIHREWVFADHSTEEELKAFLGRHDRVILKPAYTNKGEGVRIIETRAALEDWDRFYAATSQEHLVIEELIVQHEVLKALNPTSVNTIRVAAALDREGQVHIIGTSLRVGGAGKVIDNLSGDGYQYPVDPKTGIVIGCGSSLAGASVYFHPSTNKQVIGLQIPNWDHVCKMVQDAFAVMEGMRYVGWDIAVTPDGCDLVEANINQGCNGLQLDGRGKLYILQQYV